MNKIIKQELLKVGVVFNDNDTHIVINKVDNIDSKFVKVDVCYIIEYNNELYEVDVLCKDKEHALLNGVKIDDNIIWFYKKLSYNEFKVISKV